MRAKSRSIRSQRVFVVLSTSRQDKHSAPAYRCISCSLNISGDAGTERQRGRSEGYGTHTDRQTDGSNSKSQCDGPGTCAIRHCAAS